MMEISEAVYAIEQAIAGKDNVLIGKIHSIDRNLYIHKIEGKHVAINLTIIVKE